MKKRGIAIPTFLFGIVLLGCFFQNWLMTLVPSFGYLDEILTVVSVVLFFASMSHGKGVSKKTWGLLGLSVLIIIWGLFCNFYFGIQKNSIAIAIDVISNFKFLFIYLGFKAFVEDKGIDTNGLLRVVLVVVKIFILILTVFALLNLVTDIGMSVEVRYGIRAFSFVYGTAGHVINQMTYAILMLKAEEDMFGKKNTIWMSLCIFLLISTMKTRAFIVVAIYFALYYFFVLRKKKRIGLGISIVGVIIALVGYSQFEAYFMSGKTPRQMFVKGAVEITKSYFPFGTGFGTYGSSAAADYYSPLYYTLGFQKQWGMSPDTKMFLNDNYLPMIFGQFGLIFGIIFCLLVLWYCKNVISDAKRNDAKNTKLISFFFVFDIVLSSIQSSYLAHYSVVTLTMIFVLFFYPNRKEEQKEANNDT